MMRIDQMMQRINEYIVQRGNESEKRLMPVTFDELRQNCTLREALIDFLGDIYVCSGMDADYCDNQCGSQIQQLIDFLASIEELC